MFVRTSQEIGTYIRMSRKDAGLSQTQLAERSGCSQRFVSQLEQGKRTAELGKVLDVLAALDLVLSLAPRTPTDGRAAVARTLEQTTRKLEMRNSGIRPRSLADYLDDANLGEAHGTH